MFSKLRRAQLLMTQSRHQQAVEELHQALADDPNIGVSHSMLAICLAKIGKYEEATSAARQAIHLAPSEPFSHHALAVVLSKQDRDKEALPVIEEAIRLDPRNAEYLGQLAAIQLGLRNWQGVLSAAEQGLAVDPENGQCLNLRAVALLNLGDKELAESTIILALAKDPQNALTHGNQGWTLLDSGKPREAIEHFREALRLDPNSGWAREGIVEALKAKNWQYRIMLAYFHCMTKLNSAAQCGTVIGLFAGYLLLLHVVEESPEWAPFVIPLLILYVGFVLFSWTARPMFNLLLRLNQFGRLALSRKQIVASNWLLVCLVPGMLLLAGYFVTRDDWLLIAGLVVCGMMIPVAGIFECSSGWPRITMAIYAGVLAVIGGTGVCLLPVAMLAPKSLLVLAVSLTVPLLTIYVWGVFLTAIVVDILSAIKPEK